MVAVSRGDCRYPCGLGDCGWGMDFMNGTGKERWIVGITGVTSVGFVSLTEIDVIMRIAVSTATLAFIIWRWHKNQKKDDGE